MIGNFMIFGDSYSTYEGYIPDGYATYYCPNGRVNTALVSKMAYQDTWWARLIDKCNFNLVRNDSWSGSTICHTGYGGEDCSQTKSFICRYKKLLEGGFFENKDIDILFVFGGTNDSWADSPLGEKMDVANIKESDLYYVRPAITYFLEGLKKTVPKTKIYFILNDELKEEIVFYVISEANRLGVEYIQLSGIEKDSGHPTIKGMETIYQQVLKAIS